MAFYIDHKVRDIFGVTDEFYTIDTNGCANAIADKLRKVFRQAHPGSYLASSIQVYKNQVIIDAPKYNMIGFMKGDKLQFDEHESYACELDEEGSKIAIRKTRADGSQGNVVAYQQVGNWIGFAEQYAVMAIREMEAEKNKRGK